MKKLFNVVFIFCLLTFGFAAEYNKSVDFFTATKNISSTDKKWLSDVVDLKLKTVFSKYTNLSIIDDAGSSGKNIINFYKKSDDFIFNEKTILEVRNLSTSDYGVFTEIINDNENYSLSSKFINIKTGEVMAVADSSSYKTSDYLYLYDGCASDEIIIALFETLDGSDQFNLFFSPVFEKYIMHGECSLSNSEKSEFYESMIEFYNKEISMLDKQIEDLNLINDRSAFWTKSEKIRLKSMQNRIKGNLKNIKKLLIGVYDGAIMVKNDESKDSLRSFEQIGRIEEKSVALNEKYHSIRNSQTENCSIFDRVKVIELKKNALAEFSRDFEFDKQNILNDANKKIRETKTAFDNNTYYSGLSDNNANSYTYEFTDSEKDDKAAVFKDFRTVKKEILDDAKSQITRLENDIKNLAKEIDNDYKKLENNSISSLGSELFVTCSKYDIDNDNWSINIVLRNENDVLFNTTILLSYEDITGKKPVKDFNLEGFDDFVNNIDFYDSLFLRGSPVFIFELNYSVTPVESDDAVKYIFNFSGLKYHDTETAVIDGNNINSLRSNYFDIDDFQFEKDFPVTYDLRICSDALSAVRSSL